MVNALLLFGRALNRIRLELIQYCYLTSRISGESPLEGESADIRVKLETCRKVEQVGGQKNV
jgi:hypothetical protein